jgi:hypothetical protein
MVLPTQLMRPLSLIAKTDWLKPPNSRRRKILDQEMRRLRARQPATPTNVDSMVQSDPETPLVRLMASFHASESTENSTAIKMTISESTLRNGEIRDLNEVAVDTEAEEDIRMVQVLKTSISKTRSTNLSHPTSRLDPTIVHARSNKTSRMERSHSTQTIDCHCDHLRHRTRPECTVPFLFQKSTLYTPAIKTCLLAQ